MKLFGTYFSFARIGKHDVGDIVVIDRELFLVLQCEISKLDDKYYHYVFLDATRNQIITRYTLI